MQAPGKRSPATTESDDEARIDEDNSLTQGMSPEEQRQAAYNLAQMFKQMKRGAM